MNKQMIRIVVGLTLVIVGILTIASCVPGEYAEAEAASLAVIPVDARANAETASLARWEGLGEMFGAVSHEAAALSGVVDTARWEAKGAYYIALRNSQLARGQDASVARWQAKAEHFGAIEAGTGFLPSADVTRWIGLGEAYAAYSVLAPKGLGTADSARWEARGAFYKNMAGIQLARGQAASVARWQAIGDGHSARLAKVSSQENADAARWIAKGDFYTKEAQTSDEISADVARWIGLGERYQETD